MKTTALNAILSRLMACLVSLLAVASPATAAITAFTSFENEPAMTGMTYKDLGDGNTDHDLINNPDDAVVDSTTSGSGMSGDLGFNARIVNTRLGLGLTDVDEVGVVNSTDDVVAWTDGIQGYKFQDTDDLMIVEFDPVSILAPTQFEIDYFVSSTAYEETDGVNDMMRISLTIDGSTVVPVLDTTGSDIDDLDIEGRWIRGTVNLSGLGSSAVLTVAVDTDFASEEFFIDRVVFTAVPEPGSLALTALAAMALVASRRSQ